MRKIRSTRQGISFIELMVVVSILVLLSLSGLVMFKLSTSAARDSRKIADVRALSMAIEQYFSDNSFTYPDLNGSTNDSQVRNALGAYFPSGTPPRPEGGGTYHVRSSADEKVYCIYAQLELARNHNCQGFQIGGSEYCEFTEVVQGAPRFCMTSTQN